jgi:hypothetical protein
MKKDISGTDCPAVFGYCANDKTIKKTDELGTNCVPFSVSFPLTVYDKGIASYENYTEDKCKAQCINVPSCVAYTFDRISNACELKNKVQEIALDNTYNKIISMKALNGTCENYSAMYIPKHDKSGKNCSNIFTEQKNTSYEGNDLFTEIQKDVSDEVNMGNCKVLCMITPGCKGTTYNSTTKICSVKSKLANKKSDTNFSSTVVRNFGMCPDGVTVKQDGVAGRCFGQCPNDWSVMRADKEGSNCKSQTNNFGLCPDLLSEKADEKGSNCLDVCENDASISKTDTNGSNCYGLCDDNVTWKTDDIGTDCPGYQRSRSATVQETQHTDRPGQLSTIVIDSPLTLNTPSSTGGQSNKANLETTEEQESKVEAYDPLSSNMAYAKPVRRLHWQRQFSESSN